MPDIASEMAVAPSRRLADRFSNSRERHWSYDPNASSGLWPVHAALLALVGLHWSTERRLATLSAPRHDMQVLLGLQLVLALGTAACACPFALGTALSLATLRCLFLRLLPAGPLLSRCRRQLGWRGAGHDSRLL